MLRALFPSLGGVVVAAVILAPLHAQEIEPVKGTDDFVVSFDEVKGTRLIDFVMTVQMELGYQFHYKDSDLKPSSGAAAPTIFTIGSKTIRRADLFKYFQAVLREQDFVCVRIGSLNDNKDDDAGFWSIRRVGPGGGGKPNQLKSLARIVSREELGKLEGNPGILVTVAVPLKYVAARDASTVLTTYFADQFVESVRNIDNSNTLLLTGYASTLAAIIRLIDIIDTKPENMEVQWFRRELDYAVADELQPILKDLVTASRGGAPGGRQPTSPVGPLAEPEPQVIAEPRTNSLLVTAVPETLGKIKKWIDELDVEVDPRGDTHVYRLKNIPADELQERLELVIQGQQQGQRGQAGNQGGAAEQQASVVAHIQTNSVIITASRTKYAELLEIIKQLDVRPAQVLLEAAIIEISNTLGETLGVELQGVDANDRNPFGVTNFGFSELLDQDGDGFFDTRVPNIGQGLTGGIFDPKDFQFPVLLSALANEQDANVLSLPSILTNDNQVARIESKDEVPYQENTVNSSTGEAATSGFGGYAEAGIIMQISPTISAGNFVRMHLNLEISTFSGSGSPPPRIKRLVDTEVTIPDSHTMVIGGIIIDDTTKREDKIPILGDIPLLGFLFRTSNDNARKVNLYIFITPHVIGDDFASLDDLSYRHRREAESLNGKVDLINRFFPEDNPDVRAKGDIVDPLFDMPSYKSPPAGEVEEVPEDSPVTIGASGHTDG